MDAGISAIIAASISTLAGGIIGFTSSYYTSRQLFDINKRQASLPRQMDSAEFIGMILFKILGNEKIEQTDIDKYISYSYWLPRDIRLKCLAAISKEDDSEIVKQAHDILINFFDELTGGV